MSLPMAYLCDMKKIIILATLFLLSLNTVCMAQVSSGRFYSLGSVRPRTTSIVDVPNEELEDSVSLPLSPVQSQQAAGTEYSTLSLEELKSLIEKCERQMVSRDSINRIKSVNNKRIHSYRQWNPRELNLKNLTDVMSEVGLSNKLFVLAQALLETGNFSSRVCREYNNLFGLYDSKNRDYYRFERWEDSVVGYGKMIQYRYKGGNYLHFLKRIGYAEDPRYITKVARVAKSIYNSLFHD